MPHAKTSILKYPIVKSPYFWKVLTRIINLMRGELRDIQKRVASLIEKGSSYL